MLCAREGAAVVAADRDQTSADETVRRVAAEGGAATAVVADVSRPDEIDAWSAVGELGGLDGVVYNVGIGGGMGLDGIDAGRLGPGLAVNLRGAVLVAKAALGSFDRGASIVFISSVAGIKPGSRIPAYDASKAALGGLMRHVALEGARRVRANIVAPGLMDTPLGRVASQGRPSRAAPRSRSAARAPGGRRRTPRCSSCPTSPRTSPARRSSSTAASPRCAEPGNRRAVGVVTPSSTRNPMTSGRH